MNYRTAYLRSLRASSRLKKRLAAVAALGVAGCVASLLLLGEPALDAGPRSVSVDAPADPAQTLAAAYVAPPTHARARRVYPYSIVPGGVADRAEAVRALRRDKVVAAHYASFDAARASAVTVGKPRAVYVSYRKGDQVYWTANKVMLAQGETLLSDGSSEIRTRCGNRISETPQMPVAAEEPSAQVLDTAMDTDDDAAEGAPRLASTGTGDAAAAGQGPSFVLSSFPYAAGLDAARNGSALASSSGAASAAGLGPQRPLDGAGAVPLMRMASTNAATQVGTDAGASGTPGGPADTAPPPANPGAGVPGSGGSGDGAGSGGTSDGTSGGTGGGTPSSPVGGSTPVLASVDDTVPGGKAELPPLPGTLAPIPTVPVKDGNASSDSASVPEPGTLWLSGVAFGAMLLLRRVGARRASRG